MKTDLKDFQKKYKLIASSENHIEEKSTKCRFCKLDNTKTTFKQKTHLIPELLGENNVLLFDECDSCNNLFSGFESHLSKFYRPYLMLVGVKGKKKIPKFQSRTNDSDETTRTQMFVDRLGTRQLKIQTLEDYKLDKENKIATIAFRKEPYIPLNVFKSILKIGLSLLPIKYHDEYIDSFNFLFKNKKELKFISTGFAYTLNGRKFTKPTAELYKARKINNKKNEYPEMTLLLFFANQVIQIFLPYPKRFRKLHNSKRILNLILYPSFALDDLSVVTKVEIKKYDFKINYVVKETLYEHFSFESGNFNIPTNK